MHFAALLMFLHGNATSPFDWVQRTFFLSFHTGHRAEREGVFREFCRKIEVNPEPYLVMTSPAQR